MRARSLLRSRRAWMIAVGVALVAVLAIGAGIAWHFSSRVVALDHSPWPEDVTVRQLGAGRIVLSRSDATLRPGIFGLLWQGGSAIAGEVMSSDADSVTRRLRRVRGLYLRPGMKVGWDADVYTGNPREAVGLPFRSVHFPDELGPMPAWLIPGRSRTWAIVVHGLNGSAPEGLRIAPTLHRAGLPVMLIAYRGDVDAPPGPDDQHHMGLTEWRDLEAASRYAISHGARRLFLIGYSMGGAITAQFMERSPLVGRVAGLLLDSPVLDWRSVLEFNSSEMGLPSFAALPVEWALDVRISPDWDSLDALSHPEDFHLPTLLFQGTEDESVPPADAERFAQQLPRWVTYYSVPGAGHTEGWNVDPRLYERRLSAFLRKNGI